MHLEMDRYEADIILRRSFGFGNWLFGPQIGFKYLGIKNYKSTLTYTRTADGHNVTQHGEGYVDAYGPSIGGVVAFIPGNPETSPITISLIANVAYLRMNGKDPNSPLYTSQTNIRNAGYNPNGTYYGLDIGNIPVYEFSAWEPNYNVTLQMTYNIFAGFNATIGGRYNYAKHKEEYFQMDTAGGTGSMVPSLTYFEYWGAFINLAYTW